MSSGKELLKKPLPDWCAKPSSEHGAKVKLKIGSSPQLDLPPNRKFWILGRKDGEVKPHLVLKGHMCSRIHAVLLRDESGNVYLRDEQSTMGTFLGKERAQLTAFQAVKWQSGSRAVFGADPGSDSATITIEPLLIPKSKVEKRPREEASETDKAASTDAGETGLVPD